MKSPTLEPIETFTDARIGKKIKFKMPSKKLLKLWSKLVSNLHKYV